MRETWERKEWDMDKIRTKRGERNRVDGRKGQRGGRENDMYKVKEKEIVLQTQRLIVGTDHHL